MVNHGRNSEPSPIGNDESDFDWSASNDKALVEVAHTTAMALPETPRKTPRTSHFTSPGKRNHPEIWEGSSNSATLGPNEDVFNTPRSSQDASGLPSPVVSPMRGKPQGIVPAPANLAAVALRILQGSNLSHEIEQELIDLLNKHDLRMQGIAKGRDITRTALGNKEKRIVQLEARIAGLEAERETSNTIIAHLKRDMTQTSSSRSRKRGS
jgi:hypothetical protein